MAKPKWGTKRFCDDCGTRFYDLNRQPVTCPKCGAKVKIVTVPKSRRGAKTTDQKPKSPSTQDNKPADGDSATDNDTGATLANGALDNGAEVDEDRGDEDGADGKESGLIEDTSDLTKDSDDVSEVLEHVETDKEDKA